MMKKRRSMLGRRHLLTQQAAQGVPAQPTQTSQVGGSGSRRSSSWRGRGSAKKNTPQFDKPSQYFKKCLFSKSPGMPVLGYRTERQERSHHSSNEDFLDETGIASIAPTPKTSPRSAKTPSTLQTRRVQLEKERYGPLRLASSVHNYDSYKPSTISFSTMPQKSSYVFDFNDPKPPNFPGPSRLEKILLEEKLSQASAGGFNNMEPPKVPDCSRLERLIMKEKLSQASTGDFNNLEPPKVPDCTRLERLFMKEKLEQPDPDFGLQNLTISDPNPQSAFAPSLSSTCIGTPDSGKKDLTEEMEKTVQHSKKKLSMIQENSDDSFEMNERTITEIDRSLMDTTVKANRVVPLEKIPEQVGLTKGEPWENVLSRLDLMEQEVKNRTEQHLNAIELLKIKIESDCQQDINNIKLMRETLKSLKITALSSDDKENSFFKVPTSKKKQLDNESKWLNSVKKENPGLLKTPNANRNVKRSATLTRRSLSNALVDVDK